MASLFCYIRQTFSYVSTFLNWHNFLFFSFLNNYQHQKFGNVCICDRDEKNGTFSSASRRLLFFLSIPSLNKVILVSANMNSFEMRVNLGLKHSA